MHYLAFIFSLSLTLNAYLVFFRTETSFLKAEYCAGVGSRTFSVLTATGPCQWPRYTVPKEPEPIRLPISISSTGISHSSTVSLDDCLTYKGLAILKQFVKWSNVNKIVDRIHI